MQNRHSILRNPLLFAAATLLLTACDNDDDIAVAEPPPAPPDTTWEVTVTNVTNNQVFSPVAAVLHVDGYHPWVLGAPVTIGLEEIAEGGATGTFVNGASADPSVVAVEADAGPLMPGASTTLSLTTNAPGPLQVSVATMLIRTNDGFTGVDAMDVDGLATGDSRSRLVIAYDAGTEANSETEATLVETGEGFNPERNDSNVATVHTGVVTRDDGLATSFLDASHRWDNPVARISVTRVN